MASLLQSVLRRVIRLPEEPADGTITDSTLLRRFHEENEQLAFALLMQRHGGLVWAVCRQMLPGESDAEDAFQATFLTLIRSAGLALRAKSIPGWLHGVAVKVCLKSRRSVARLRQRELQGAKPEATEATELPWSELQTAVHQEIEKLPATHRLAIVLCDLQGIRQLDAATQLGWKLGTLTGRLARARQQLLKRLTARGLAPSTVAGAIALGHAAQTPANLTEKALALTTDSALSPIVLQLTQSVIQGVTMKVKMLAATLVATTGVALTVGGWFASADAQSASNAGSTGGPPIASGNLGGTSSSGGGGDSTSGEGGSRSGVTKPTTLRVEHALLDMPKTERELTELFKKRQADGWEFIGQVQLDNIYKKLAFKRLAHVDSFHPEGFPGGGRPGTTGSGGMMGGPGMGLPPGVSSGPPGTGGPGIGLPGGFPGGGSGSDNRPATTNPGGPAGAGGGKFGGGGSGSDNRPAITTPGGSGGKGGGGKIGGGGFPGSGSIPGALGGLVAPGAAGGSFPGNAGTPGGGFGMPPGAGGVGMGGLGGGPQDTLVRVLKLRFMSAEPTAKLLKELYPSAVIVTEVRTASLVIRADAEDHKDIEKLLQKLDVDDTPLKKK